jgi:hypothetical protein
MKMMKLALLGGAAFAVTAASAQADELADLKAQLESLQNRVVQLESQPVNVPSGASFLTFGEGTLNPILLDERRQDRNHATTNTITVMPTADAAPSTVVTWNGEIRAALTWTEDGDLDAGADGLFGTADDETDDDIEVNTRARIWVTATTDTAVGEVGVYARVQGTADDFDANAATVNSYYGWWNFAPGWTFSGGYRGTLANVNHGQDENATFGTTTCLRCGDAEQLRLTYSSGPFEWNVAIEDYEPSDDSGVDSDLPAATANLNWSNDSISARIMGGIGQNDETGPGNAGDETDWIVGVGATFGLGDMAVLSLGADTGSGWRDGSDDDFWGASAYLRFDMSDATYAEISYGIEDIDDVATRQVVNGGVYYAPVDQLTIGIQADWTNVDPDGADDDSQMTASFVTWWRF